MHTVSDYPDGGTVDMDPLLQTGMEYKKLNVAVNHFMCEVFDEEFADTMLECCDYFMQEISKWVEAVAQGDVCDARHAMRLAALQAIHCWAQARNLGKHYETKAAARDHFQRFDVADLTEYLVRNGEKLATVATN
eukprot:TRINITY_DN38348_c0_g1_i1.p1 TRINITY_DN38348_c0_g1~~TRINITY_DN38348_c0_g1_i1.p1  ORF type:complete len:135 (+),score=23.33 TRINITY_DN38348_c0_g1_i1:1-405(+)